MKRQRIQYLWENTPTGYGGIRIFTCPESEFLESVSVDPEWWRPHKPFFSTWYKKIAQRIPGYLFGMRVSEEERTLREVSGVLDILVEFGHEPSHDVLADVPCGYGRHAVALARHVRHVFGCDINEEYVCFAKRTDLLNASFIVGDMQKIPIKDSSIDCLICLWASFGFFESREQDRKVVEEWWRLLRPGGIAIMHTDLHPDDVTSGAWKETLSLALSRGQKLLVREAYDPQTRKVVGVWGLKEGSNIEISPAFSFNVWTEDDWISLASRTGFRVEFRDAIGLTKASESHREHVVILRKL